MLDRIGGAEGDRTPDLMTASHALSQLSYGPKRELSNEEWKSSVAYPVGQARRKCELARLILSSPALKNRVVKSILPNYWDSGLDVRNRAE